MILVMTGPNWEAHESRMPKADKFPDSRLLRALLDQTATS